MSRNTAGISVVVMAYEEVGSLREVIEETASEISRLGRTAEIIIVDDGSKDGTADLADQLALEYPIVRVIHHPENRGLGGVYRTGFAEAGLEYVTFFPADGQFPASIISQFVFLMDKNDLVLGYLQHRSDPWINKVLSATERIFYRILFGPFPRFQGILMFRRSSLQEMKLISSGRGWAIVMEFILRARDSGCRIVSIPTEIRPRTLGHSKVSNLRTIWSNLLQVVELRLKMQSKSSVTQIVLAVVMGMLLMLHLLTLQRYPAPFVDEGWFGSRAWAYKETHQAFGPLDRGVFDRFPGYWTYFPWLPNWLQSLMYWNSSSPELFPLRLLSFFGGIVLLIAVFFIGKRLGGSSTAWLSAFLLVLSRPFFYSAHLARYDILVAAFGFGAIALGLQRSKKNWPHLLSGLCIGAAIETHPYGALFAPIVLILYFVNKPAEADSAIATFRSRQMWTYVAGAVVGISIYAALHIIRYPETWLEINRIAGGGTHSPPIADPSTLLDSFQKFVRLARLNSSYLMPPVVLAFLWFCFRRTGENKIALTLLIGLPVLQVLLIRHKLFYYAILFSPAMDLAIAHFFFQIRLLPLKSSVYRTGLRVIVLLLAICSMLYSVLPLRFDHAGSFRRVESELRQYVRPGESLMGNQVWWLAQPNHPWYSWEGLYYYRRFKQDTSLLDAFREFRPQVFILDIHVETFMLQAHTTSYGAQFGIRAEEFREIIRRYGQVRAKFDGGYYGTIHIIEFDWE